MIRFQNNSVTFKSDADENVIQGALKASTAGNQNKTSLEALNGSNEATISVSVDKTGLTRAEAPSPSDTSNDKSIATTEWVKARIAQASIGGGSAAPDLSNYVDLSSTQTITGTKTFNDIKAKTPSASDNSTKVATTAWVKAKVDAIDTHLETIDEKNTTQDNRLNALETKNPVQASSGLELLTVLIMPLGVDETENQFRYLNGQVIMQDQFADFTSKLKARMTLFPGLFTTEENWQAEKTNSKLGQCGKFVVDDTAGTIRLPCVVNTQGLVNLASIGGIKSESLPNITGSLYNDSTVYQDIGLDSGVAKGAIRIETDSHPRQACENVTGYDDNNLGWNFDASRSSSTYQDNAPVQQEAIQYPYVIVVGVKAKEATKPINDYQVNNVYSFGMSQYYKGTMNNNSWLRSNNQWNSGTVYVDFYAWLLEHLNANDAGFKLSTTEDITDYDYVINTADQTFKLPVKNGQEGVFASGVKGNGMTVGFTDGVENYGFGLTHSRTLQWSPALAATNTYGTNAGDTTAPTNVNIDCTMGLTTDPSKSGIVVDTAVPSEYNLYYYVGDTLQNASLINIARIEEKLVDLSSASRDYLVESYHNGTEWYRVYSDGWIEQGGRLYNNADVENTISFLKPFKNTDYSLLINHGVNGNYYSTLSGRHSDEAYKYTTTNFKAYTYNATGLNWIVWSACGY